MRLCASLARSRLNGNTMRICLASLRICNVSQSIAIVSIAQWWSDNCWRLTGDHTQSLFSLFHFFIPRTYFSVIKCYNQFLKNISTVWKYFTRFSDWIVSTQVSVSERRMQEAGGCENICIFKYVYKYIYFSQALPMPKMILKRL